MAHIGVVTEIRSPQTPLGTSELSPRSLTAKPWMFSSFQVGVHKMDCGLEGYRQEVLKP